MIEQSPEEIAEAMKENPLEWAKLYLDTIEELEKLTKIVNKYANILLPPEGEA
jgi:hypothetical protein